MSEAVGVFLLTLSALFPIVDPLGGGPLFLALTHTYTPATRRGLAWRIAVNGFFLMAASYFIGSYVLSFFGISLPVVQVAGGLVLAAMGWKMLREADSPEETLRKTIPAQDAFKRAFYPLTLPLTVGPGSVSVAVTLGANASHLGGLSVPNRLAALIAMALIAISIFLCYAFADRLARALGETAMSVIVRLSSFLLFTIGVQITWNGISSLLSTLTPGGRP
jgi:multiple antibiotic resistance protein